MVGRPRYSLILRVPGFGDVRGRERALDQLLLDLEAQDDVERVGRLVGIDADQAALDEVDMGEDVVERPSPRGPRRRDARATCGMAHSQNSGLRAICFSTNRLWLSWIAMPRALPSGQWSHSLGRPCS